VDASLVLPRSLIENRRGSPWLKEIPEIVGKCSELWELRVGAPLPQLFYNYLAAVERTDGSSAILKICPADWEFESELNALRLYDGRGAVRLLESDEAMGAMLLEPLRPGQPIKTLDDDDLATAIACRVMKRFWRPPPQQHRFRDLEYWGLAFHRHLQEYGGAGPIPAAIFERGESMWKELVDDGGARVVLHGDLNYGNLLSSARDSWLAIDPKGVLGESVFDTAILLHDPSDRILAQPSPSRFLARRVDVIVEVTGFDRRRVIDWGFAYAVLSGVWSAEEQGSDWEEATACAEVLQTL
jgi:streptomycin 6-kinase